ncbi:MAG: hypothetical protein EOP04_20565 [Proteobacteria bacterium]|nr:MAG: hypothetical protein EOP04_20565 [Pseudomonadota bacterium]
MNSTEIYCPGGAFSQTGASVAARYPGASIINGGSIAAIKERVDSGGFYVIPIWNSHEGEVKASDYFWDGVSSDKLKILDLWAKRIYFWFVKRNDVESSFGKIGSVVVAKSQCSDFLKASGFEFEPYGLTTEALEAFQSGAKLDGVLIAPTAPESLKGYVVVDENAANAYDFTTFVHLVNKLETSFEDVSPDCYLTGITMPALGYSLSDLQQSVFEKLLENVEHFNNFPKLLFVFGRESKVGLLFEGEALSEGDLLSIDQSVSDEIGVHEGVGSVKQPYTKQIRELFQEEFPDLNGHDFILHRGFNTCLFACPPLGIYTHGYEIEKVEPVIRFYIGRLFQL